MRGIFQTSILWRAQPFIPACLKAFCSFITKNRNLSDGYPVAGLTDFSYLSESLRFIHNKNSNFSHGYPVAGPTDFSASLKVLCHPPTQLGGRVTDWLVG